MAEWISVYGRRVAELSTAAMQRELEAADLWTQAEALGLPDDEADAAVESALHHLRIELAADGGAFEVHWKPEGRPIRVKSVTGPEAREQVTEALEEFLPPATEPGPARIRDHLHQAQQVVNLEMSAEDAQHLGAALGGLLALSFAESNDGLVWFFDRDWVSPEDPAATIWTPDE